jgi:hypothetical protein
VGVYGQGGACTSRGVHTGGHARVGGASAHIGGARTGRHVRVGGLHTSRGGAHR